MLPAFRADGTPRPHPRRSVLSPARHEARARRRRLAPPYRTNKGAGMDLDELRYHRAAMEQKLSLSRNGDGTWSLAAEPNLEPLNPTQARQVAETIISGNRIRLADGRIFPLRMTTEE